MYIFLVKDQSDVVIKETELYKYLFWLVVKLCLLFAIAKFSSYVLVFVYSVIIRFLNKVWYLQFFQFKYHAVDTGVLLLW
jgi:hypothetical protein